jgi:hypothetical protein
MSVRGLALVTVLLSQVVFWPALARTEEQVNFGGRVVDAATRAGLANLEVKLTPPRASRLPIRLATTDGNGMFTFGRLSGDRYLLEVSQGVNLLYRSEVNITRQQRVEIALRRRQGGQRS